jgi:hypothetical protein
MERCTALDRTRTRRESNTLASGMKANSMERVIVWVCGCVCARARVRVIPLRFESLEEYALQNMLTTPPPKKKACAKQKMANAIAVLISTVSFYFPLSRSSTHKFSPPVIYIQIQTTRVLAFLFFCRVCTSIQTHAYRRARAHTHTHTHTRTNTCRASCLPSSHRSG